MLGQVGVPLQRIRIESSISVSTTLPVVLVRLEGRL